MTHPFGFPYTPYPTQLRLMESLQQCIRDGKVGVFESPTGTGKTLSLICALGEWIENVREGREVTLHSPGAGEEK